MQLEHILFCEMARNEASGQVSIIGYYVGDAIGFELPLEVPLQMIPNLSCVIVLGDMDHVRTVRMQCQVRFLEKEVLNTPTQDQVISDPKKYYTLLFGFAPFPCLQGPGDYEFRFIIQPGTDAPTTYARKFRIETRASKAVIRH